MNLSKTKSGALIGALMLLITSCHPWFESRFPWEEKPDPNQKPIITTSAGRIYQSGTPSYVPLIDECMSTGETRAECIDALPREELAKLEAMEAERGAVRSLQADMRQVLNTGGGYHDVGVARINLPRNWLFSVEQSSSRDQREVITARNPDGTGLLYIQSMLLPDKIREEALRNLTNVDSSVQLSFDSWGDYSGFQYDYAERGVFFRQWWLSDDQDLVLISYQSLVALSDAVVLQLEEIVRSLQTST